MTPPPGLAPKNCDHRSAVVLGYIGDMTFRDGRGYGGRLDLTEAAPDQLRSWTGYSALGQCPECRVLVSATAVRDTAHMDQPERRTPWVALEPQR